MTPTPRPTTRRTPRRAADGITPRPPPRRCDDTLPAGALGLTGLIERLAADPRFAGARFAAAAARPLDAPAPAATGDAITDDTADAIADATADAIHDAITDAAADPDTAPDGAPLDLALLDRADPSEALARALGPRRLAPDTVRLGPRPGDPADPRAAAPSLLAAPARPADAAPVARAPLGRAALPPGVDESAVLRQVSDALRAGDRSRTAEIALHPAELGRVRLRITMHDGVARVVVGAEQPAVVDLLASGLDELRRDLMAHGLQVGHLEVEAQLSRDPHGRHEAHERDDAEAPERPAPKASTPRRMARGLIDIEA
ncbi:MAG: flagellar hook-length control protein FliK [Myxococcales bacterium]|nr:flagellar hook-length control protein FliK [Myxococcales bacterium]